MSRYLSKPIEDLASQMAYTPPQVRRDQLTNAEQLYWELEEDGSYPLDYVLFRLTGYRADGSVRPTILVGRAVRNDLITLVENVSETLEDHADSHDPIPLDLDAVCKELRVSSKTISRYRKQGLFARRMRFGKGKRERIKLAFLPESLDRFTRAYAERVNKAGSFERIDDDSKHAMVLRARRIAIRTTATPHRVSQHLARKYPWSAQAIRKMLIEHDAHDPRFAIFRDHTPPLTDRQRRVIARAAKRGVSIAILCERFGKTRDAIYRAINLERARELEEIPIRYTDNPTFHLPTAHQVILESHLPEAEASFTLPPIASNEDDETLTSLTTDRTVLDAETERALFARYNYLKLIATRDIGRLDRHRPAAGDIDRIETTLRHADRIKNRLVQTNLALVVATAKRHQTGSPSASSDLLTDLIGEGNLVLMLAIDTFDIARGNRFSTYLTWALMRHFAQLSVASPRPADHTHQRAAEPAPTPDREQDAESIQQTVYQLLNDLEPRERQVIARHFGLRLTGDTAPPPQTLAEIGRELGVSAERARQIENRAVKKLRRSASALGLSVEQLLTAGH